MIYAMRDCQGMFDKFYDVDLEPEAFYELLEKLERTAASNALDFCVATNKPVTGSRMLNELVNLFVQRGWKAVEFPTFDPFDGHAYHSDPGVESSAFHEYHYGGAEDLLRAFTKEDRVKVVRHNLRFATIPREMKNWKPATIARWMQKDEDAAANLSDEAPEPPPFDPSRPRI